jgi:hypothetical protein
MIILNGSEISRWWWESRFWDLVRFPTAIIRPKSRNSNVRHDGILSIGNFMLMMNNHFARFQLPGKLLKTKKMCSLFPWQHGISYLFFLESCVESGKNTDFASFRSLVLTVVGFPWNDPISIINSCVWSFPVQKRFSLLSTDIFPFIDIAYGIKISVCHAPLPPFAKICTTPTASPLRTRKPKF